MRLFFLFLLIGYKTFCQGVCNLPNTEKGGFSFETPKEGCSPHSIKIKDISGGTNVRYIYNYKEEPKTKLSSLVSTTDLNTSYTIPNQNQQVYVILQYGEKNGKEMYACENVLVNPYKAPKYSYEACGFNNISFKISDNKENDFDNYKVSFNGNTKEVSKNQLIKETFPGYTKVINLKVEGFYINPAGKCPISESKTVIMDRGDFFPRIDSLILNEKGNEVAVVLSGNPDQEYGFILRDADVLGTVPNNSSPNKIKVGKTNIPIPNPEKSYCISIGRQGNCQEVTDDVCTQPMKIIPNGEGYLIDWSEKKIGRIPKTAVYTDIIDLKTTLEREQNGSSSILTNSLRGPFDDKTVNCKEKYTYILKSEVKNTYASYLEERYWNKTIVTQKINVDRKNFKPPSITDAMVSVENEKAKISFIDNSGWNLNPKKYIVENKIFNENIGINTEYIDFKNNPALDSLCYSIRYEDKCGSISLSSPMFCTIHINEKNDVLNWTTETPFSNKPVSKYEIIYFDENSMTPSIENTVNAPTSTFSPDLGRFENEAIYQIKSTNGLSSSFSNIIKIPLKLNIYIPDAFSPNEDLFNKEFKIYGNLKRISIFKFEIYNNWGVKIFESNDKNFSWDGKNSNDGIFTFKLSATLNDGTYIYKTGRISVFR